MTYAVRWSEGVKDDLRSLGYAERVRIVKKIESHLAKDPLKLGKPLSANLAGLYRYRIGDYRVIYQVKYAELLVIVIRVGHRGEVYE